MDKLGMGTGWRRALCTSVRGDPEEESPAAAAEQHQSSPSPRSPAMFGFFSDSACNPTTPRLKPQALQSIGGLRCRTKPPPPPESPNLQCMSTAAVAASGKNPRTPPSSITTRSPGELLHSPSNPSSPRFPSRFARLKTTLLLSRNRCGICDQSARTGQGTAVFTAECSHSFHFPCIAAHVRSQSRGNLICPTCSATWRQVPLLSSLYHYPPPIAEADAQLVQDSKQASGVHRVLAAQYKKPQRVSEEQQQDQNARRQDTTANIYEPLLLSMTAPFNPIPEGDDEDGGGEDLKGFLVDPSRTKPSPDKSSAHQHPPSMARTVEVSAMPEAAMVSAGRRHRSFVVALRAKAPRHITVPPLLDTSNSRAPIDLVTVLDLSESMMGVKLHILKRAMRMLVSSLGPNDRLSIVAFSADAAVRLLPLRSMTAQGQRSACHIVDRLVVCGSQGQGTCVGDALRKATGVLEERDERNPVATIILLSDGLHREQHQDDHVEDQNATDCHRSSHRNLSSSTHFAHLEIPVHAPGFRGVDRGLQQSHVPMPMEEAFAKCVGGLLSVVLEDVHMQLHFPSGEISAVYSCGGSGGGRAVAHGRGGSVRIGDLYAEEERDLLVELRAPSAAAGGGQGHQAMSVKYSYRDPATRELIRCGVQTLVLPPLHHQVRLSEEQKTDQLKNLFVATRAVADSRRLVDDFNDFATALHLISSARSLLLQSAADGHLVHSLEAELAFLRSQRREQCTGPGQGASDAGEEMLTPTSAWRAAERLAKLAIMRKSLNRVSDLHGFENARF